jgi:hypothetical protein
MTPPPPEWLENLRNLVQNAQAPSRRMMGAVALAAPVFAASSAAPASIAGRHTPLHEKFVLAPAVADTGGVMHCDTVYIGPDGQPIPRPSRATGRSGTRRSTTRTSTPSSPRAAPRASGGGHYSHYSHSSHSSHSSHRSGGWV